MAYRFVHAADIHLDSPLKSLALRDPALAALIGDATRQAFVRIVDLCLEERVDALMLAGDLYDGDQTSMKTARFLAEQLRRLDQAGIRTFVIRGNHDALSKIPIELTLPPTVRLFSGRADIETLDNVEGGLDVRVHGLSFAQSKAPDSFLPKYKAPVEGAVNIGLMHTSLGGAEGHDVYAPCGLADLQDSGFSYWALGHVHSRSAPEARGRAATVVMPGIPQGRDIGEPGPKSVTLVTVRDDGTIVLAEELTSVAEFANVSVPVGDCEDWGAVVAAVERGLAAEKARTRSEHLVARVRVTGSSPLTWRLLRDADLLRTEAEDCAIRVGSCWIDKVEVACVPGRLAQDPGARVGPLGELHRLMEGPVRSSERFRAAAREAIQEIVGALPPECRERFGSDEATVDAVLSDLSDQGVREVLGRLHATRGGDR